MYLPITDVLTAKEVTLARSILNRAQFSDGAATAGYAAKGSKRNMQAVSDPSVVRLRASIESCLFENLVFNLAARPKRIIGPMFSRYTNGQGYGTHIDEALIDGARTDLAFTIFLSHPDDYGGGELVIETTGGDDAVKLPAGSAFVYPATTLHRVADVTSGQRLAAVGWVQSFVRSATHREILFDLDTAAKALWDRVGRSRELDAILKCSENLKREWFET